MWPMRVAALLVLGSGMLIVSCTVAAESVDCGCSRYFKPVCGSNGQTYENLCILTCEQRLSPALTLAYAGTCCPKAEHCTTFFDPVCDNFGETHDNECVFNYKQCVAKRSHNQELKIERKGPCEPTRSRRPATACNFFCDEVEELICDNQGHTHKNLCKFELARCRRTSRRLESPEIRHLGECNGTASADQNRKTPAKPVERTAPRFIFNPIPIGSAQNSRKVWNYGSFAPPPVPIVDATDIPPENDPYGFGNADTTPSERTLEPFSSKLWTTTAEPPRNTAAKSVYLSTSLTLPESDLVTSNSPARSDPWVTSAASFTTATPSVEPQPQPAGSSIFQNCLSCMGEVDQVPICDNLNQTHRSICRFAQWNCERRMSGLDERVLVHVGSCNLQSPVFSMDDEVCPSKCSRHYKPVCDTDGMTHPNLCAFQMFNCQQRKLGNINVAWLHRLQECPEPHAASPPAPPTTMTPPTTRRTAETIQTTTLAQDSFDCPKLQCSDEVNSVCDSEGNIYKNDCEFAHARCLAAKQGRVLRLSADDNCVEEKASCKQLNATKCPSDYDPICATDFVTYPNQCHFRVAQCKEADLDVLFMGDCKQCLNTPCPIIDPDNVAIPEDAFLCDQNGETKSRCEFEMLRCIYEVKFGYNITEAYTGRCCPTEDRCPLDNEPVCDSKNVVHRNRCFFTVAQCRASKIDHVTSVTEVNCTLEQLAGSSQADPCAKLMCPAEYDPVCGSDGKTYRNSCHIRLQKCSNKSRIEIEYKGVCCEEKCSATNFSPVCDSANVTHLNLCEFGRQRCIAERTGRNTNITIASFAACPNLECKTDCPPLLDPVCSVTGETFASECELARAVCILNNMGGTSLSIDYPGECCDQTPCDLSFEPVCDSEGRTHVNECVMREEACLSLRKNGLNVTIEHQGECCNRMCAVEEEKPQPICDTSGQTHDNSCQFRIAKCEAERKGVFLNIAHMGECCKAPTGSCANMTAVCDSDGQSHTNMCEYEYKKCVIEKTLPKTLSIVHHGECCVLEKCIDEGKPVCDTRGVTHSSLCHFNNSKCVHEKVHSATSGPLLMVAYRDKCCESECNDVWEPVCDQHGDIYRNKCVFEHSACELSKRAADKEKLLVTPCPTRTRARALR